MEYEVYGDLLFLVNFSMDFLGFYLCAKFLHRPLTLWRGLLAAALGGVYAVAALFFSLPTPVALLADATVCVLLCAVALTQRGESHRTLARLVTAYLIISALLGGVMTVLSAQINRIPDVTQGVVQESGGMVLFSLLAPAATLIVALAGKAIRHAKSTRTVALTLTEGDAKVTLRALCDSGNLLHEPISARPVIPVDCEAARAVIPAPVLHAASAIHISDEIAALPASLSRRVRIIPARTAADTGERLLLGWQAEHVYIEDRGRKREIAVYLAPVSLASRGEDFYAVIPAELL